MAKGSGRPARRVRDSASAAPRSAPSAGAARGAVKGLVDLEDSIEPDAVESDNMDSQMEMDAFDQLPPAIREALRGTPYGCPAEMLFEQLMMGHSEQQMLAFLESYAARSRREAVARGTPAELTAWPALRRRRGAD